MVTAIKGNATSTFGGALDLGSNNLTTTGNADVAQVITDAPAFSALLSADQTVSTATWSKVQCNTEEVDTNSNYDNSTNYRFTPNVAGWYQINGHICMINNTTDAAISIYKNGSSHKWGTYYSNSSGTSDRDAVVSSLVYLNGSTDYVELYGYTTGSTNKFRGLASFNPSRTYFNGFLARAV